MRKRANKSRGYIVTRVLVGALGLVLSVVFHELFHILVHWGHITHISFFPNLWTVVEINTQLPPGYDLDGEEMGAYAITLLVIFITTMIIFKMKDSEDKRTSGQILFPHDKNMQKLDPSEMLESLDLDDDFVDSTPTRHNKPPHDNKPSKVK